MEKGTKTKRSPPVQLSLSEIEAAKLLIQLSSGDSEQDRNSNNNSNSYSVNHDNNKVDSEYVSSSSSSSISEMSDSEDDECERCFPRRNKKYRYVNEDLYRVTSPLPAIDKAKMIKRRRK